MPHKTVVYLPHKPNGNVRMLLKTGCPVEELYGSDTIH